MRDVDIIRGAWPRSRYGYLICSHCGSRRDPYFAFCIPCWERLPAFIKMEFIRAVSRVEKAQIILASRPTAVMELMQRTPGERSAYLAGYEAGVRAGCEAIVKIAQSTASATTDLQAKVALMLVLAESDLSK